MATGDGFKFEEIDEAEVIGVPRGRKSTADPALVAALANLTPGRAIRLVSLAVDPGATTVATDKARIGSTIRSASRLAGIDAVSIIWSRDGIPQVKIKS